MANEVKEIKKGSLRPIIQATIYGNDGSVIDITGATAVKFTMYNSSETKINAVAGSVVDATSGQVSYTWTGTDTDTAGTYYAYFDVTLSGGYSMKAPTKNELIIEVWDTE